MALGKEVYTYTIAGREWTMLRSTWEMQEKWGAELARRAKDAALEVAAGYRKEATPLRARTAELTKKLRELKRSNNPADLDIHDETEREVSAAYAELQAQERAAAEVMERWQDRKAAGEFEWFSMTVGQMAQMQKPMQFYILWLKLQPNHAGITLAEVAHAHLPKGEYNADGSPKNYFDEWREALMDSEGAGSKNETAGTEKKAPIPSEPLSASSSNDEKPPATSLTNAA